MTDQPITPDPQPFSPASPSSSRAGCGRPLLIGCGVLILLIGIAAVVIVNKAGDLFDWAMTRFEETIVQRLPDDVTEADRERLHDAFRSAVDAVQSEQADPEALQHAQLLLQRALTKEPGKLTRDDVLEIIEALEAVGGTDTPLESEAAEPISFLRPDFPSHSRSIEAA